MIIITQDREQIFNFDNIERIDITAETDPVSFIVNCETDSFREMLGEYKTQERAKEVLREIIEKYKEGETICRMGEGEWGYCKNIYEMPEE